MSRRTVLALVLLTAQMQAAVAAVFGGSNLGFQGYPEHTCRRPEKPYPPVNFRDEWDRIRYNGEVDDYNRDVQAYVHCVTEYVENAQNDMRRIRERVDGAVSEVKSD